jgi:hypothetical protein
MLSYHMSFFDILNYFTQVIIDYFKLFYFRLLMRPKVPSWAQKNPIMLKSESSWNLIPLPTSSIKGGKRGVLKALGLD